MAIKIKELPKEERPYEKLTLLGVESLSNEELIAILLKSGYHNISSKDLASLPVFALSFKRIRAKSL